MSRWNPSYHRHPEQAIKIFLVGAVVVILMPSIWRYVYSDYEQEPAPNYPMLSEAERDKAYFELRALDFESPDTLSSPERLYYEGLLHYCKNFPRRGRVYFDAIPKRFPDSPYLKKLERVEPWLKTIDGAPSDSVSPNVIEAKARIMLEALPLLYEVEYITSPRLIVRGTATSDPWWLSVPGNAVSFGAGESEYALWPVAATITPNQIQRKSPLAGGTRGMSHQPSPADALVALGTPVAPLIRDHLTDPRLIEINYPSPIDVFLPVGQVCFTILCVMADYSFGNSYQPLSSAQSQGTHFYQDPAWIVRRLTDREYLACSKDSAYIEPEVLAEIDLWIERYRNVPAVEWLRWKIGHSDLRNTASWNYLTELAKLGQRDEAIQILKGLDDPNDLQGELLLAQHLALLNDTSLFPRIVKHFQEGLYSDTQNVIQMIDEYGPPETMSVILQQLQRDLARLQSVSEHELTERQTAIWYKYQSRLRNSDKALRAQLLYPFLDWTLLPVSRQRNRFYPPMRVCDIAIMRLRQEGIINDQEPFTPRGFGPPVHSPEDIARIKKDLEERYPNLISSKSPK